MKGLPRRQFEQLAKRHDGDRYIKNFTSWNHLVTLIYGQLGGAGSLRDLEAGWNVQARHHYHLGCGPVKRSTLSDANRRRSPAIFAQAFASLSHGARRLLRHEAAQMLRLIDASPIPLSTVCAWARCNGRTRGLKLHVVHDPHADQPMHVAITAATVNDVLVARDLPIEAGATYVFDKAYVDYSWWARLQAAGCAFVTRAKTNVRFEVVRRRCPPAASTILEDDIVRIRSKNAPPPGPLRRIRLRRDNGTLLTILTNDLTSSATAVADLYRTRWQIELLFRWIKQHLKIRSFLGRSDNAIRLQILAAMIAFLLLRIAAHLSRRGLSPIRFANLVRQTLFSRKPLSHIDKPPPDNNSTTPNPNQMTFAFAP
jgi:putative transposase